MNVNFYKLRAVVLLWLVRFLAKILFVEFPPILSVAGLIEKKGKLLFIDLPYMNGLGLPGGIVGKGETLEESLRREILEETGLKVESSKYLWSTAGFFKVPSISVVFGVRVSGNLKESPEGKPIWIRAEEAVGRMGYKNAELDLKKYLETNPSF